MGGETTQKCKICQLAKERLILVSSGFRRKFLPFLVVRIVVGFVVNIDVECKQYIVTENIATHASTIDVHWHGVSLSKTQSFKNHPI